MCSSYVLTAVSVAFERIYTLAEDSASKIRACGDERVVKIEATQARVIALADVARAGRNETNAKTVEGVIRL